MEEPISAALRGTFVLFGVISIVLFFTNRKRAFAFPALILSGLVIGLFGVGRHSVNMLAEFGLIALLFHIGLKFPASRLREMWKVIVVGGLAQVFLTAGFGFVGALFFELDPKASIVVGLAASMSSTALVAAFLKNRNEQNSPHGSISIAILVAQDLLVLPLVLVTTLLFPGGHSPCASGTGILTAFGVLVAVVVCGRLFLGPLLSTVLQAANQQLFVVVIASVVIGVGWALAAVGLSPALGGLIVGLLIGSHDCRLEAVEATRPFRYTFGSVFFVSIGMLLHPVKVFSHWEVVLGATVTITVVKLVTGALATLLLGFSYRVAALVGAMLAHVGELAFVILATARLGLGEETYETLVASAVLGMGFMPLLARGGEVLARRVGDVSLLPAWARLRDIPQGLEGANLTNHTVVIGYGPVGHLVAEMLHQQSKPFVIVDLNPAMSKRLRRLKWPFAIGDSRRSEVLQDVGIKQAEMVVVAISDEPSLELITKLVRRLNPEAKLLVRTQYAANVAQLRRLGADSVVPEDLTAGVSLLDLVTEELGLPSRGPENVRAAVEAFRHG